MSHPRQPVTTRSTVFLRQPERFKEQVYREGARDIRLGYAMSAAAVKLMEIARKRELTEAEDLTAVTLFGTSEEVMQRSMVMVPKRAAERGLTEANGGVYVRNLRTSICPKKLAPSKV